MSLCSNSRNDDDEAMTDAAIKLGAAGLGRAFMLMLPTFRLDPRIELVAAADPRPEAQARFAQEFAAPSYASVEALCRDPAVEAVYIATPHQFHAEHVKLAAEHGKHILVEKPMAIGIGECLEMIAAAAKAHVALIVGHSHSFDAPIKKTRELIGSGAFGAVRAITAMNFTDFLYRPRRREELITGEGGGVIFSQAAHQIDIIRLLGGGRLRGVRAETGVWDASRPTEGAYHALFTFESGAYATAIYGGYAHFDSDEFCGWIGELGRPKDANSYGTARRSLKRAQSPAEEEALKATRTYGAGDDRTIAQAPPFHEHFGFVLVSCERADLRPMPSGVLVYEDTQRRMVELAPPTVPRAEVVDELYNSVRHGEKPIHSGEWGLATLEACLAILESARRHRNVVLAHQFGLG